MAFYVGYTTGTFDIFHEGHVEFLKTCKIYCDRLIVGLTTDELAEVQKRKTIFKYNSRKAVLSSCRYVDCVLPHTGDSKIVAHDKLKFDALFIGTDYYKKLEYKEVESKTTVVYIQRPEPIPESRSSSGFINKIYKEFYKGIGIRNHGIGGAVISIPSDKNTNVIVKQVRVGKTEDTKGTKDVYSLVGKGDPLPRNWKKHDCTELFPMIPGINSIRELVIHEYLKDWSYYPVLDIRLVYEADEKERTDLLPVQRSVSEREFPSKIYWLYQQDGGETLKEWYIKNGTNNDTWDKLIEEVQTIIEYLKRQKIVHGDIHPSNICVKDSRISFIIDWGWCYHPSFEMSKEEEEYYKELLNSDFDSVHFKDSLEHLYSNFKPTHNKNF
jgi:glycerol-3-phosphate cytidylyltransferase